MTVRNFLTDIRNGEDGQGLAEYALILSLIATTLITTNPFRW